MKKVTKKQVFGAVVVLCLAIVGLAYFLVYNKYTSATEELEAANKTLEAEVKELEQYFNEMNTYKTNTANLVKGIEDLTADYTSQANEEDFIMTAVDMQAAALINYDKINIDKDKLIHTISEDIVKGAGLKSGEEKLESKIEFHSRKASYSNTTDYMNLKNVLQVVFDKEARVGVNSISYKRDANDNNFMKGTIDVTYYTISGMDKPYDYPKMDNYLSGGGNDLFGKLIVSDDDKKASTVEE